MDRRGFFALLALLAMGNGALAGTTTEFVQVANNLFDDAELAGFTTWAMRVTADTDWTNADLDVSLVTGTFHHVEPSVWGNPRVVNGLGDTAGMAPTNTPGNLYDGFNGTASFVGDYTETATEYRASWFSTRTDDLGTFDIAMITLSDDANGDLRFRTIAGGAVEEGGYTAGTDPVWFIDGGRICTCPHPVLFLPQPASLCLALLGGVLSATLGRPSWSAAVERH